MILVHSQWKKMYGAWCFCLFNVYASPRLCFGLTIFNFSIEWVKPWLRQKQ